MVEFKNIMLKHVQVTLRGLADEKGNFSGINIKFAPISSDEIYETKVGEIVSDFPYDLQQNGINLDSNSAIELYAVLLNAISTYAFANSKPKHGEIRTEIKSKFVGEARYLVAYNTRSFFRDDERSWSSRYKVKLSIFNDPSIFGVDTGNVYEYEEVMIRLTKRDVRVLMSAFQSIISQFLIVHGGFFETEYIDPYTTDVKRQSLTSISKIEDSVVIGGIWLHGQEILNLLYVKDKLLHHPFIEKKPNRVFFLYRQLICTSSKYITPDIILPRSSGEVMSDKDISIEDKVIYDDKDDVGNSVNVANHDGEKIDVSLHSDIDIDGLEFSNENIERPSDELFLIIRKYDKDHKMEPLYIDEKDPNTEYVIKIPFSTKFLAFLSLALSVDMIRYTADVIEDELHYRRSSSDVVDPFSQKNETMKTTMTTYHLNMMESYLGIRVVNLRSKDNPLYRVQLVGQVKDGVYLNNTFQKKVINEDTGLTEERTFDILPSFNIKLMEQWPKLVKALSVAYTGAYKKENRYEREERDFLEKEIKKNPDNEELKKRLKELNKKIFSKRSNYVAFNVRQYEDNILYQYDISITSSETNKALAVLNIDKYKYDKKENKKDFLIGSYRQPLFEKYVFHLLIMFLGTTKFIQKLAFTEIMPEKELIKFNYRSMKNVDPIIGKKEIEYGIRKIGAVTFWGQFGEKESDNIYEKLDEQDRFLLNQSCFFKILHGKYLPVVGYKVCIGPDGYITDTRVEIDTERPIEVADKNTGEMLKDFYRDIMWAITIYFGTRGQDDFQWRGLGL